TFRVDAHVHEPRFTQELEVRARRRGRETSDLRQLRGAAFPVAGQAQHRAAARMSHRPHRLVQRFVLHGWRPIAPRSRSCTGALAGTETSGPTIPAWRPTAGICGKNIATTASTNSGSRRVSTSIATARSQV